MTRAVLVLCVVACSRPVWAQEISAQEYATYIDWRDGRDDPRLKDASDELKLQKIAKSLGMKPAHLQTIIDRVAPVAKTIARDTESVVQTALRETPLKGRVVEVHVDANQAHVVLGIKWRCGDSRDADKEAAFAGWAAARGTIVRTVVLWCVDAQDTKQFSARAAASGLGRIDKGQIDRFAASRYIRLLEEVKRGPHQ